MLEEGGGETRMARLEAEEPEEMMGLGPRGAVPREVRLLGRLQEGVGAALQLEALALTQRRGLLVETR